MSRSLLFTVLTVFLIASYFFYEWFFSPTEPTLNVDMISGQAWQRYDGVEAPLQLGDKIRANREVFVKEQSRVGLTLEETHIELEPNTTVHIQSISEQHIQLSIDDGRILARARRGSPRLQIRNEDQNVNLENGQIRLDVSDKGGLQVKVDSGNAELQSTQQRLVLSSMEGGTSINGTLQRLPSVTLDSLPEKTVKSSITISGSAAPGTKVEAAGVIGYAQVDMRFSIVVPLKFGINQFTVILTGPMDERSEFPIQIEQLPSVPILHHAEIKWQDKEK